VHTFCPPSMEMFLDHKFQGCRSLEAIFFARFFA
jgi:hypothetical protein